MSGLHLRDYQIAAIDAVFDAWKEGMWRPAVVLPTGAGKTVVFSELIRQWRERADGRGARVMVLVHRDELADQAMAKIRAVSPELRVGKVKAEHDDITADVMVCSVQTLARKSRRDRVLAATEEHGSIGLIITDECHHAAAASYGTVYAAFPGALHLGVTATLARGDGVGLGSTWDEVVFSRSPLWMISKGYLTDVRALRVDVAELDMDSVKSSRGDWQAGDLGRALMESGADDVISRAYVQHAKDRPGVVFTPTVETAHAAAESLNRAGVRTAVVSGETPADERRRIYDDFRSGAVQVLSNCMVLTEGFDAPWASCAVIARPTQSQPLYVQMVGRVLRPFPGKEDALVLDLAGASSLGVRTLIDLEPGAVTSVEEGETLAEAVVREAEAGEQRVRAGSVAFELKHREIAMFHGSKVAWNRTEGGVLFIGCGSASVFLWPSRDGTGLWDVCVSQKDPTGRVKWTRSSHVGLDLSSAMAWGEVVAEDQETFSTQRSASWRRQKPSEKQVAFAATLGIPDAERLRRGDLSEAIDRVMKSREFDRYLPRPS